MLSYKSTDVWKIKRIRYFERRPPSHKTRFAYSGVYNNEEAEKRTFLPKSGHPSATHKNHYYSNYIEIKINVIAR